MNIWLAEIWRAWRASFRRPGFLLLAAGVLALGVGSTVAVFTLIDHVLLKPLPYAQPAQLVNVGRQTYGRQVSPLQYQQLQSLPGMRSIGLVEAGQVPVNVTGGGKPEQVTAIRVDRHLLSTLGVAMVLGRNFTATEDRPHGPDAVILSHGFWQRRFAGDAHVLGRSMQIEGKACTIVGVLPASFNLLGGADILLPTAIAAHSRDDSTNYLAIARMAPGTGIGALGAEVDARIHAMYAVMGGKAAAGHQRVVYDATPLRAALRAGSRHQLTLFMACALFVLLVALVNLVNLMLLRALARSHDVAVHAALGASAWRLAWPGLAEGLLIGIAGTLAGVGLAASGLTLLGRFMPTDWFGRDGWHLGFAIWGLAFAVGLGGALLSAALAWWRGRAATMPDELREGGRSGLNRRSGYLGKMLVVVQVALAAILLFGAGLFLNALYDAAHTPLGFSSRSVLTFEMAPIKALYTDVPSVQQLVQRTLQRLQAEPGVVAATAGTNLPVGGQLNMPMRVPGGSDVVAVQYRGVSPGFFATYGISVRKGRAFARTDSHGGQPVAVVNQAFAHQYFGGHAIGKTLDMVMGNTAIRIVGVVGDTRQYGPLEPAPPILYVPMAQMPDTIMQAFRSFAPLRFAVRVRGAPGAYRDKVQTVLHEVAPEQPIANVGALASIIRGTTAQTRLSLTLVGLFALLTLVLAAAGLYAVMAVAVAAREREFGVRMALGAAPLRLARLVVRGGLMQVGIGLVLGVAAGWILTGVLRSMIEQVAEIRFAATSIVGVCIVLALAGLLACLVPAWRAARVAPMRALRGE